MKTSQRSIGVCVTFWTWTFLFHMAVTFLPLPSSAEAAEKHVLIVQGIPLDALSNFNRFYQKAMLDVFKDMSQSVTFESMILNGDPASIRTAVAQSIDDKKPDLLIALTTVGLQGVIQATQTQDIPVVFTYVSDPVALGLIREWGETSTLNVTGVGFSPTFESKIRMLQTILEGREIRQPLRIAYLVNSYPSAMAELATVKSIELSAENKFDLIPVIFDGSLSTVGRTQMFENALTAMKTSGEAFDAIWIAAGPMASNTTWVQEFSQLAGLPVLYGYSVDQVKVGAAFGLHSTPELIAHEITARSVQILSGMKANDLPIVRPSDLINPVNLTTLLSLGIIPASYVLELAGEEIYQ